MKPHLLFFCALLCTSAFAQVGVSTKTTDTGSDLTPALTSGTLWSGGALPGNWRAISSASDKTSKELLTLGLVFGARPQQVQAFYEGGQLSRLEVVWLEAGNFFGFAKSKEDAAHDNRDLTPSERQRKEKERKEKEKEEEAALAPKRKEFADRFQLLERSIPPAITALAKVPGRRINLGNQGLLHSRATEWVVDGVNLRFTADDDQLISLSIQPAAGATKKLAEQTGGIARRRDAKEAVEEKSNGDLIITNIPMFNQGGRGYCAMGTLAMVTQYYGLSLNIDQLAAKAGYRDGDTANAKVIPVYQAAAKEAKLRFTEIRNLPYRDIVRMVEKGKPILVWRNFSRERDEFHSNFARRVAADPTAELPDPRKDKDDRAQWPTVKMGGHASLITGINKKRNEVLFTESWGENNRNRRMRAEEMEATTYIAFLFEP